jgi:hypothetical protein
MTGRVRYHDHPGPVVALPEYHEARLAVDRLVHAIMRIEVEMSQEQWVQILGDFAATNPYADMCRRLHPGYPVVFPHQIEAKGSSLRAHYRCPLDGTEWTCGWAVDAPWLLAGL